MEIKIIISGSTTWLHLTRLKIYARNHQNNPVVLQNVQHFASIPGTLYLATLNSKKQNKLGFQTPPFASNWAATSWCRPHWGRHHTLIQLDQQGGTTIICMSCPMFSRWRTISPSCGVPSQAIPCLICTKLWANALRCTRSIFSKVTWDWSRLL